MPLRLEALARFTLGLRATACVLAASSAACAAVPTTPPNLVLVTLDTTRADRLGCYGRSGAATPSLDTIARGGVLFENALSPAPITLVTDWKVPWQSVPILHTLFC